MRLSTHNKSRPIRSMVIALTTLAILAITGCGTNDTNGGGASPTPAMAPISTTVSPTPQVVATPTLGGTNGVSSLDIQVTQFSVAANFEIRGQFNATNNGTADIQEVVPSRIRITGPDGETLFEAVAPSVQGGVMDARPQAGLPPGMTRPFGFSASPGTISRQVTEGEAVTGILTLTADGHTLDVALPTTKVTPIRIP